MSVRSSIQATVRRWLAGHPREAIVIGNVLLAISSWTLSEAALLPVSDAGMAITPVWPSIGLAVAVVWLGGPALLPGVFLGALAVTVSRLSPLMAVLTALAPVAEVLVDTWLLRTLRFDDRLERVRDTLLLALVVAPVGGLVAATFGMGGVWLDDVVTGPGVAARWVLWLLRDWLGVVVVGSLIFTWVRGRGVAMTTARVAEALGVAAASVLGVVLIFLAWRMIGERTIPVPFVFFPVIGWAALRFGPRGVTTVVAALTLLGVGALALGVGPLSIFPPPVSNLFTFLFMLLASQSGLVLAAVIAERDDALQKRLQLEEQLRHSQKMEAVGRLAGGIAHDFNNLLTAIIGYTEIVMTSLDPKDPRRADADEIGRAAMRAADLTRQMLAFSRRQVLQPKILNLNTALAKVEPMLRRLLGEDIALSVLARADQPLVRVDPGQIEQVIVNLAVNARDAMPGGGRLTVETNETVLNEATASDNPDARPGAFVVLSVSDTGVGMPAAVRARIFEPYFTTKDVGKGTGLGLSTAYGIVRQSDGHINVASEEGQGTTFRILLPRAQAEAEVEADSTVQKLPVGTEHVLLVEDDPSVRRLTRELLTRLGYSVTEAASGRAGLSLGADDTRHFDLALCDVILGDMSGPAVAEALHALRPSIRVLYMSGYSDDAIVRTGVLDEGKPFLQKPFTPIELARKIREVLTADREAGAA